MGSYCSVHNNTDDIMYIIYGPNILALEISGLIVGVVAIIASGGTLIPGLEAAAVTVFAGGAVATGLGALALGATGMALDKEMEKQGYRKRSPGEEYKSEKLPLSLVHQANIIRVTTIPESKPGANDGQVVVKNGSMTVWTGSTNGSTRDYYLSNFNPSVSAQAMNSPSISPHALSSSGANGPVTGFTTLVDEEPAFVRRAPLSVKLNKP